MLVLTAQGASPAILSDELTLINAVYAAVSALDDRAATLQIVDNFERYILTASLARGGFLYLEARANTFICTISGNQTPQDAFAALVKTLKPKSHDVHENRLALV